MQTDAHEHVLDFRAGKPHELMALEDNTRIINILKNNGVK